MIFEVLQIITEEINNYFEGNPVSLENIASVSTEQGEGANGTTDIILSLLNLQEEITLKNTPNYSLNGNKITYKNPIVNLNLYVLFSANNENYEEALKSLSKVLEFFQGKRVFTQANSIYNRDNAAMSDITNFKFRVDLHTPTFEELNYIWGTLGGKQLPSVMYKVSLIEIDRKVVIGQGPLITEVSGELNHIK